MPRRVDDRTLTYQRDNLQPLVANAINEGVQAIVLDKAQTLTVRVYRDGAHAAAWVISREMPDPPVPEPEPAAVSQQEATK